MACVPPTAAPPPAPVPDHDLRGARARLRAARPDLLPAEARVADALLTAGATALHLPVAELASLAGTSQATVVRLAQRLGYRRFGDLRIDLARADGADATLTVFDAVAAGDSLDVVADKVAASATAAVAQSRALLETPTLARIVDRLARAPRIETYGVGASGLVALDAAAKLRRLGLPAWSYPDPHQQAASASLLADGCLVLAFSHSGATRDVLDAASTARDSGACLVAVTSSPLSPLARLAEHVLLTAAGEPIDRSGSTAARLAQLFIIDVVTVGYAQAYPTVSQAALARTAAAVRDRRVPIATGRDRA